MSSPDREAEPRRVSWANRLIVAVVVLVALVAGWFIAAAFLPTWWAQRIGDVADGSLVAGIAAGLFCGVLFTALPLLAVRVTVGPRARWGTRWTALVAAALLALPNLTTLVTTVGSSASARSARLVVDRFAPGFRGATLAGAILGAIGLGVLWSLLFSRRRRRRQLADLRAELRRREAVEAGDDELDDDDLDHPADDARRRDGR